MKKRSKITLISDIRTLSQSLKKQRCLQISPINAL